MRPSADVVEVWNWLRAGLEKLRAEEKSKKKPAVKAA
jgi:hypothetical protein